MTVTVTRKPGGITQLFNTETGRVTYKCKAESGFMLIEAFGGIVKFNQKNAMATVTGHITSLESCDVLEKGTPEYKEALSSIISAQKEFAQSVSDSYQKDIQELENQVVSHNYSILKLVELPTSVKQNQDSCQLRHLEEL